MAWDNTKPVASSLLSSAEVRANWDALQASMFGRNWVADPNFYIWSRESANGAAAQTAAPDHWRIAGTSATLQRCGVGLTDESNPPSDNAVANGMDGWAAELTYGSSEAQLYQTILDDTPLDMAGRALSMGAWVKSSTATAARLKLADGVDITYSSYHTGGGNWEWLTVTHTINAAATAINAGLTLSSGTAHLQGATVLLGSVPPLYHIPCASMVGTWTHTAAGTPAPGYVLPGIVSFLRPVFILGATLTGNANPTSGVSRVEIYSSRAAAWVQAVNWASSSTNYDPGVVSATYANRCLEAVSTAGVVRGAVAYVTSGTYVHPIWLVRGLQFLRPQEAMVSFNDPTKYGA